MKKLPRFWIWVIKIVIIIISYGYIYFQLVHKKDTFSRFSEDFLNQFNGSKILLLAFVFLLMFLNWSLESIKWQRLVRPLEKIRFWQSFQGVIIGLTTSIFTPNRIGEYFGRIWVLSQKRVQGIFATITGSIAQLSITILAGILSLFFFLPESLIKIHFFAENKTAVLWSAILLLLGFIVLLFSLPVLAKKFKHLKKLHLFLTFLKDYSSADILKVLFLSGCRYFIFVIQFFLLLNFFDIPLSFDKVLTALGLIYFTMAFIPIFTITEIGVRGSLAITIFSIFVTNQTGIFLSMTLLWIINIALPAFVGSFFLFKLKIKLNAPK